MGFNALARAKLIVPFHEGGALDRATLDPPLRPDFVVIAVDQLAELCVLVEVVSVKADTLPLGAAPFLALAAVAHEVGINHASLLSGTPPVANLAIGDTYARLRIRAEVVATSALAFVAVVDHALGAVGGVALIEFGGPLPPAAAIDTSAAALLPGVVETGGANTSLLVNGPLHVFGAVMFIIDVDNARAG